jgi:polyvinyl alcohol dehydrogenase (cytochrome)
MDVLGRNQRMPVSDIIILRRRRLCRLGAAILAFTLPALGGVMAMDSAGAAADRLAAEIAQGRALYASRCASCHDNPTGRIPARTIIEQSRTPEIIIDTLANGVMKPMASGLTGAEIRSIAVSLAGREPGAAPQTDLRANLCATPGGKIDLTGSPWNGWGRDLENTRFQPDPGLTAGDIPRLKVKWAFAYPGTAYGQPVIVAGRVFIQTRTGQVMSLDAATGCTHWVFEAGGPVRTAVTVAPIESRGPPRFAVYFGDEKGRAFAVDAMTGQLIWRTQVDEHPLARIGGAPKVYDGRVYVPVSSIEEGAGTTPRYSCCTFQGSVAALNAATGQMIWRTKMIDQKPHPTRVNPAGAQMYGPAGVAVWASPTIDAKRGLLYVGTGDSYTDVPVDSSDAIVALDMKTGRRAWIRQVVANDAWIVGCPDPKAANCPETTGPDADFASSPILYAPPGGKQIILAAAKSGIVYAMDPDASGKIIWQKKLGQGSPTGAIMWGPAVADGDIFVAMADATAQPPYAPGGVFALRAETGDEVWHTPAPPPVCGWGPTNCSPVQPGAVTAIPGAILSGSWDGHLRAYSENDGKIFWDFDTGQSFDAVNGVKATGGAVDKGSQTIADGMMFVNSGVTLAQRPGNLLLAFTVDGR